MSKRAWEKTVRVEVREPVPLLRYTLRSWFAALGADLLAPGDTRSPRDVVVWSLSPDNAVAAVQTADRAVRILVVVDDPSPETVNQLLAAGARAVLDRHSSAEVVARAALSVARDYLVLPSDCMIGLVPGQVDAQI